MDARAIERALVRVAHEILERNKDTEQLAFVGIRSRGVHLAERIRVAISSRLKQGHECWGRVHSTLVRRPPARHF